MKSLLNTSQNVVWKDLTVSHIRLGKQTDIYPYISHLLFFIWHVQFNIAFINMFACYY